MDGLDIPLIRFLGTMFTELYEDGGIHPDGRPAFDNMARFGANMRPIDYEPEGLHSPVFHYPYEQTKNALINLKKADEVDPFHGIKMQYLNPNTGEPAMPTLDCYMQLLPSRLASASSRVPRRRRVFV